MGTNPIQISAKTDQYCPSYAHSSETIRRVRVVLFNSDTTLRLAPVLGASGTDDDPSNHMNPTRYKTVSFGPISLVKHALRSQ